MTSLRAAIKNLRIKPGDVILVRDPDLVERIAGCGIERLEGTPVLLVKTWRDVSTMSEKAMNALGWYRRPSP